MGLLGAALSGALSGAVLAGGMLLYRYLKNNRNESNSEPSEPSPDQIRKRERTQQKRHDVRWIPCPAFAIRIYAYDLYPKELHCLFRFGDGEGNYVYTKSVDQIEIKAVCVDGAHTMLLRSHEQRSDGSYFQLFQFEKPVQKVTLYLKCGEAVYQTELNLDAQAAQKTPPLQPSAPTPRPRPQSSGQNEPSPENSSAPAPLSSQSQNAGPGEVGF